MTQYKKITDLEISQAELEQWAKSHNTDEVVALAIHAIADDTRSPEEIWAKPTPAEYDNVVIATAGYIDNDLYDACDSYRWGDITLDLSGE